MLFSRQSKAIFIFTAFNLLLIGCAQTKVSQCQKIIESHRNIANEIKNLSDNGTTQDPQKALLVADAFEEAAQEMKTLEIHDQQLLKYQDGFAEMYTGWSNATRDFVAALDQKEVSGAKSAKEKLQKIGTTEQELVNGISGYCIE